jgi:nucleotide-binding universal stress UspA family protein
MFVSIRRILFPTDFSEPAKEAQKYAMALADRFGAELHLLHVIPEVVIPFPDSTTAWTLPPAEMQLQVHAAEQRLVEELGPDWAEERRTRHAAVVGNAVEEIVRYASENEIGMIVIGTHGRTGLSRLLLGSVAEKLVRLATCPVLTVHPQGHQFLIDDPTSRATSAQT